MTSVKDFNGKIIYEYKECEDDFTYDYTDENGHKNKFTVRQKRILTFNEDLRKKQRAEIYKLIEKAKELSACKAKKGEFGECSKYVNMASINEDGQILKPNITFLNNEKIQEDLELAGYNLLVTSEVNMPTTEIYETYHNLWKIEESFKLMKSQLDARPVYLQKPDSIKGHFLICYLSVFLLRINQYIRFKNKLCANQLCEFIRNLRILKQDNDIDTVINLASKSDTITTISKATKMPFDNFFIKKATLKKMLEYSLKK